VGVVLCYVVFTQFYALYFRTVAWFRGTSASEEREMYGIPDQARRSSFSKCVPGSSDAADVAASMSLLTGCGASEGAGSISIAVVNIHPCPPGPRRRADKFREDRYGGGDWTKES
jgi:hypothetical protein